MVVAAPDATLLTACEKGYGKRTNFGPNTVAADDDTEDDQVEDETASSARYRRQRRGGKGVRDIKTTARNGKVIGIVRIDSDDELLLMTSRGKIQRIVAGEISVVGRNTMGVRIMGLDQGDTLAAVKRVPKDEGNGDAETQDEGETG